MTAKQILDAFSETLMQDERILSPRERELLMSILQNSRTIASRNPETQSAVTEAIARSVGETVTQRAFVLLGGSIVERILAQPGVSGEEILPAQLNTPIVPGPQPPNKAPIVPAGPQPPSGPRPAKDVPPPGPQPPNLSARPLRVQQKPIPANGSVAVLEAPARAQCVVLDEFLAPQEVEELIAYTLQQEAQFQSSEVISPAGVPGVVDYSHRRSRVLTDLGKYEQVIVERVNAVLPRALAQLGMEEFPVTQVEAQITASNDGDFFHAHSDDAQAIIASRRLTFVYFFHREPRQFEGGELRIHDTRQEGGQSISAGSYQSIVPQQNQIVFFPCSMLHEITPVNCPSRAFADSRFTLNGWLHK
jgi:Rps23 Pro-64 3,4-dihydroxylase Tpa1-like proline 4-hydroxylase